jgi:GT2 family glycosyltransferase
VTERPSRPRVSIVVLNWNGWRDTLGCLDSLDRLDYDNRRVLVVDNGSTDGSEERIRDARPETDLLQTGANLGYAGGNNVGLRRALVAGAEFVWVLNNDVRVEASALCELVGGASADPRCAALASRHRGAGGDDHFPVASVRRGRALVVIRCGGCGLRPYHPADELMGASLFLRAAALRDVGLFDERYFHYAEEQDLMERLRQADWRLGFACRSTVTHFIGSSLEWRSPQSHYYLFRNGLLYYQRFHGRHPLVSIARDCTVFVRDVIIRRRRPRPDRRVAIALVLAAIDACRGRTGRRDLGPAYQHTSGPAKVSGGCLNVARN